MGNRLRRETDSRRKEQDKNPARVPFASQTTGIKVRRCYVAAVINVSAPHNSPLSGGCFERRRMKRAVSTDLSVFRVFCI